MDVVSVAPSQIRFYDDGRSDLRHDRSACMESPRDSIVRAEFHNEDEEAECATPEAKHVTPSKL